MTFNNSVYINILFMTYLFSKKMEVFFKVLFLLWTLPRITFNIHISTNNPFMAITAFSSMPLKSYFHIFSYLFQQKLISRGQNLY